jgi:outer membrane protein TolC
MSAAEISTNHTVYTLDECIKIGLAKSIPLQNSLRDQQIGEARIRQARAQLLPGVDVSADYTRLDEKPQYSDGQGPDDTYRASAGLSQLLYSGGSASAAIKAARSYRRYSLLQTDWLIAALKRDIRVSCYELLFAQARLMVSRESLAQLTEYEKQTKDKFNSGTASEFDLLTAQVKVANERPVVIAADNALSLQKEQFKNLIYLDSTNFTVQAELEYTPINVELDHLYSLAMENRPELLALQAQVDMRKQDVRYTKGSYFPQLYANANYTGSNPASESPTEDDWKWHWSAGLSLNWDILDGGLRRGQVAEKSLDLEKTKAQYIDLLRTIQMEVKDAYLALNHSRDVVLSTQSNVDLARRALDIAKVRYQNGLFTYLEYTDSNLSLTQALLTHYEALKVYQQSIARLQYACGTEEITLEQQ